jgi:SagB-type dehydrogenase family enzyme
MKADASQAWYVAEGKRGQQLLDQGQVDQATEVFEAILTRLGDTPTYGRAVILGRLGRCFHVGGQPDLAVRYVHEAMGVVGRLAPSDGAKSLRGTLRSELGDALRAAGQYGDARKAYEAALKIAEELKDLRGQGIDLGRLGALALAEGNLEEALTRQQAVLRLFQQLHEPAMEAAAWHQLGRVYHEQRKWDEAERHYREAARISEERGHLAAAVQTWNQLARLAEDAGKREAVDAWYSPVIFAALAEVGESPSYGRAVILGQLGRSFHLGRRPDLAVRCLHEAIGIAATLARDDGVKSLSGALHADLGDMLRAGGQEAPATEAFEMALQIARELQDLRGQADASQRLGRIFQDERQRGEAPAFEITLYEDRTTDYVFGTDLLVDGPRERRITLRTEEADLLAEDVRPMLLPCARTWTDDEGGVRFSAALGEPIVERHAGCTIVRRIHREVAVSGNPSIPWRLVQGMDGARTVAEILTKFPGGPGKGAAPTSDRAVAARVLAALAATGLVDVSGRTVGGFLHLATKKGVLPAGGLEGDAVLRLATDGNYRAYPEADRIAVSQSVPDSLRIFHALTRSRRSSRDYGGLPLDRSDFDALLHSACGVTGAMRWAGREVKLRAYPSSGALYAVEIYPVVFRVEGLEPAVYHYRAVESVLEVVRSGIDPASVVGAALPVERGMVAAAAALVCLAGCFRRHERKYGEGGYRMLVAEAGHISENLILAATALGLGARPFGGVFDDLLNHELGLDGADEQFLLAVLVGHTQAGPNGPVLQV